MPLTNYLNPRLLDIDLHFFFFLAELLDILHVNFFNSLSHSLIHPSIQLLFILFSSFLSPILEQTDALNKRDDLNKMTPNSTDDIDPFVVVLPVCKSQV